MTLTNKLEDVAQVAAERLENAAETFHKIANIAERGADFDEREAALREIIRLASTAALDLASY